MSEENPHIAKVHQETATRNAQVAVKQSNDTREELLNRMIHLEALVTTQQSEIQQLHQKYNLLLTKQFNGGSTSV
jgi:hypothetical protein